MLTQTAVVRRTPPGATDGEGNWGPGAQVVAAYPCLLQQESKLSSSSPNASHGEGFGQGVDMLVSSWVLFLPADAVIGGRDEVEVGARAFEVDGQPVEMRTPRGPHHLEVRLRFVDR